MDGWNNLVVDTNILIYFSKGYQTDYELISTNRIFISVITKLEMLSFKQHTKEEVKRIKQLLSVFTEIPLRQEILEKTIYLRKNNRLKLPDAIIAATSIFLDAPLATADKKLKRIKDLAVIEFNVP